MIENYNTCQSCIPEQINVLLIDKDNDDEKIETVYKDSWLDRLGYVYGTKMQVFDDFYSESVNKVLRGRGMKEDQRYMWIYDRIDIQKKNFEFRMKYKESDNSIVMTVVDHMRNYYKKVHLTLDQCCIHYSKRI